MAITQSMKLAFTGQRGVDLTSDLAWSLFRNVEHFINKGCDCFLFGLCYDSDFYFARAVLKHKETYPNIKLIGYIPHLEQDKLWTDANKEQYRKLIERCFETIVVSKEYTETCYQLRNIQMVNNADYLLSIYDCKSKGGTHQTIEYAKTKDNIKEIYIIKNDKSR